jgi:LysR family tcuABC transcriptional regulator
MELRQIRYFVRVVELGSMSRAALDLGVVQSALSQQISRLESALAVRLLLRTSRGVAPTEAGLAFLREAQLILRHADQATRAAQHSRLTGSASVGLAPTTTVRLAIPFLHAMRERYPDVRLHLVESLSGHLARMLNDRQIDFAVLFNVDTALRWNVAPLLQEQLYLIRARQAAQPRRRPVRMAQLASVPLILPTAAHGLRRLLDAEFARARITPMVVAEIDSLTATMDAVDQGLGATIQPHAAAACFRDAGTRFEVHAIADLRAFHVNSLCSLSDDELSPAALGARLVLIRCAQDLVRAGKWPGARLIDHDS